MSSSCSLRLPAATASKSPEGDGSMETTLTNGRLVALGREVAAVVGGPFLVAERLEPVLQVLVELLVELLGPEPEGFLVRALAAADDVLAQGEEELAQALLAPARLDELEGRVAQVVRQAAVDEGRALEIAHRRHGVGDSGVAHRHQVERVPVAGHVVGQALVDPEREAAAQQRPRDDVELEDVRELVGDQPIERIVDLVDRAAPCGRDTARRTPGRLRAARSARCSAAGTRSASCRA